MTLILILLLTFAFYFISLNVNYYPPLGQLKKLLFNIIAHEKILLFVPEIRQFYC